MYVNLAAASKPYWDRFNESVPDALQRIANNRHCGNGYFSWDGMFDDLIMLVDDEDIAAEILNNA